ncbi:hypothetical protein LTR66_002915 [Elasticomyces elasticus]|nr:hypothetical protein LTR66_002915 [Elasticomyces elasticus]
MSIGQMLEAPHTLVSLPKPLDHVDGRIQVSAVYGFRGPKRRKRPEIVAAVDGEGLFVYNVSYLIQNPRLITSYALPPHSRFTSLPCSLYRKKTKQRPAQRVTYVSVASSTGNKNSQLFCFVEESSQHASEISTTNLRKAQCDLINSSDEIQSLHTVTVDADADSFEATLDICVVYTDGTAQCVSGDLSNPRWQAGPQWLFTTESIPADEQVHVEATFMTDVDTASKGLLKDREDVLALLNALDITGTSAKKQLLCMVTTHKVRGSNETQRDSQLHVLLMRSRSVDLVTRQQPGLQPLLSYTLPNSSCSTGTSQIVYSLHAGTGKLHQLMSGVITTFDLSGTSPSTSSVLATQTLSFQSFVSLSASTLMATTSTSSGVYDTKYGSLQALTPLSSSPDTVALRKKRKAGDSNVPRAITRLLSYFSELGLAVAISGNELIGFQTYIPTVRAKKSKTQDGLLINALGKGVGLKKIATQAVHDRTHPGGTKHGFTNDQNEHDSIWLEWKGRVDDFLTHEDVDGFEALIAVDLGIGSAGAGTAYNTSNSDDSSVQRIADLDAWASSDVLRESDRRKAMYCLGKIFARTSEEDKIQKAGTNCSAFEMNFYSPSVLRWLAALGYLSASAVDRALEQADPSVTNLPKRSGDVMKAIVDFDPEMHFACEVLSWRVYMDVSEIVQTLKLLIQSFDTPMKEVPSAITAGGEDEALTNGEVDSRFQQESEAAESDLAYALSTLSDGLEVRGQALHLVLTKLNAHPPGEIVKAFRDLLSQQELVFFIHLLRIELADGGWTSRYIDADIKRTDMGSPADQAISIISNLLNCAVDAVGASGWLVGLSADAELCGDEIIANLRAETSAALEGCHEASFLSVVLNDFERFSTTVHQSQPQWRKKDRNAHKGKGNQDLVRMSTEAGSADLNESMLPMGYKAVDAVQKTRTMGNGQVKEKSKRLIGQELSMKVGKYSFERIRV